MDTRAYLRLSTRCSEWWLAQFPVGSRVGEASGNAYQGAQNADYAYAFGLERIIAGTSALIAEGK